MGKLGKNETLSVHVGLPPAAAKLLEDIAYAQCRSVRSLGGMIIQDWLRTRDPKYLASLNGRAAVVAANPKPKEVTQ